MLTHLALAANLGGIVPIPLILSAVLAILAFGLIIVFVKRYRRCPSNKLLVIYGKTGAGAAKCIHGGAAFVWPIIQESEFLPLDPFVVPIDLSNALSQENIRVSVPTTVTVAVSTEPGIMENAAIRLLGLPFHALREKAEDIILGQMRAVIATMQIEEINQDRQAFMAKVNDAVTTELEKIGLAVINTNIKDLDDESGYIKALGKKAAAEAIQQATIDEAEAKRRGEIGVAELDRDRRSAVAQAHAEAEIGESEATRTRRGAVAQAETQAEMGEAEAARNKRQRLAELDAEAVSSEAAADGKKASYRASQQVAEAEARSLAEAAARKADGEVMVAKHEADKRAEDARALRERSRLEAEVVVPAEMSRKRIVVDAEAARDQVVLAAKAEQERAVTVARGDAEAQIAHAEAEAKGVKAVLDAKAAGYRGLVNAVGGASSLGGLLIVEKLSELASIQAEAVKGLPIEKIVVWDGGGEGGGLGRVGRQLLGILPPLHEVAAQAGLELPAFLGKLDGAGEAGAAGGSAGPPPVPRG